MTTDRLSMLMLLLLMTFSGCSSDGPPARPDGVQASGKIVLANGKPLTGGTLILRPETGSHGATALIQSDGAFTLQETSGRQDIVPGKYQVFVSFPNPTHANLAKSVHVRYQSSEDGDSDVFVNIQEENQALEIRLK